MVFQELINMEWPTIMVEEVSEEAQAEEDLDQAREEVDSERAQVLDMEDINDVGLKFLLNKLIIS